MKNLLKKYSCPYSAFIESLGLKGDTEIGLEEAMFIKTTLIDNDFTFLKDENNVKQLVDDWAKDQNFVMDKSKDIICNTLIQNISTFAKEMFSMGAKVVDKNVSTKAKFGVEELYCKFDLIIEFPNDPTHYCCIITKSHESAKYSATKINGNDNLGVAMEWWLYTAFAQQLYSDAKVTFIRMTPKTEFTYENYFATINTNILSSDTVKKVLDTIDDLTNTFTDKNSPKCGNQFKDCKNCPGANLCSFYKTSTKDLQIVEKEKADSKNFVLTSAQESINNSNSGIYRVLAGAGTGKTTTLANKIVTLIQNGIDFKDILIITFSDKGVMEIREKLDYWLHYWYIEELNAEDFNIFTFNGYGDKVLVENYDRFGFNAEPELIDKMKKLDIIKAILDVNDTLEDFDYKDPFAINFKYKTGAVVKMNDYYDRLMDTVMDPIRQQYVVNEIKTKHPHDYNKIFQIIKDIYDYLHKHNLYTFADQTQALVSLATKGFEDLLEKYAKPDIICDEFQDTNRAQMQFIKSCTLLPTFNSLTMCGDDSQSIYSFRGADKTVILGLENDFNTLQDVKMVENFRSTKEIVDLANKFNDLDDKVVKKNLTSIKHGKPVQLIDSSNTGSAEAIVNVIKTYLKNGYNLYDIGVITYKSTELQQISRLLNEENIPNFISVHEYIKDNPRVKNIVDFIKYLKNTDSTIYLAEYLQAKDEDEFNRQADLAKYVGEESERIKNEIAGLSDEQLIDYFINCIQEMAQDGDRALEKLLEVLYNKNFTSLDALEDFLMKFKMYENDIEISKDERAFDAITLMTAHAAKGREYKVIIGSLDSFKIDDPDHHQCVFVMITRAMEELVLVQNLSAIGPRSQNRFFGIIEGLLK